MRRKTNCYYCGAPLVQKWVEGATRLFCESCREPLYENPVPATSIIVTHDKTDLLLVKRSVAPKKGFWCLPGGFIELGESPEQGALRELEEETGLCGEIDRLLGVTSNHSDRYASVLMVGYLVRNCSGDLKPGDDASDAAYFDAGKLPEIAFSSHVWFIRNYFGALTIAVQGGE